MKKIVKYIALAVVLTGAFSACIKEKDPTAADMGLGIKTFFPTKVVAGQPMTINGNGLADVTEIVFPGDVTVTNFQLVGGEMIRVNAPQGIAAEGGKLVIRTADDEAVSSADLTLGHTVISGYSKQEGESIQGGEELKIYGKDLEFISGIELMDADGNPMLLDDAMFYRKGTSVVSILIPKKTIYDGTFVGKVFTVDSQEFDMPSLKYSPAAQGGHWETVKTVVWTNEDPAGNGAINWSGTYRFGLEGHDGNNECITTFPQEVWEKLIGGPFHIKFVPAEGFDSYQIRICNGWWTEQWMADDIMAGSEAIVDNGDGTFSVEVDVTSNPEFVATLEVKHLLITGAGFIPLEIYFEEETWIEGGHWETVKTAFWTNEDPAGNGAINWSGTYRFGLEGHDGNNECIATFGQEVWEKLIGGPFHIKFVPAEGFDSYQIRICNGWWTEQWMADDIMAGSEAIVDNGDGTFSVEVDVTSNPEFVATLEVKHLLITGSGFIPLELYFEEEVFVNDDGPKEVDIWKNEDVTGNGAINWSGTYRFGLEGHDGNNECIATFPQEVWDKLIGGPFHIQFVPAEGFDSYQIRICNGWWTEQWMADDIMAGSEAIVDNGDGTFSVAVDVTSNPDFVATLEVKHLLITGSGFIPLRLYFVE